LSAEIRYSSRCSAITLTKEFGYDVVADIAYAANANDVTSEVGKIFSRITYESQQD
jgi:hypothetical protein